MALWLGALPGLLAQAVPDRINYQGILLRGDGSPVPAVPTDVEFRIYDTPTATTGLKWGRMFRITPDTNGAFNVVLSGDGALLSGAPDVTLPSIFTGTGSDSRYLELTVAGSTPIRPRQRFVASPYAFLAEDVRSFNQRPPEDYFLPPGMVVPFAGSSAPNGWLPCDGTSYTTNQYPRLFAAIGTAWGTTGSGNFNVPDLRGMFLRGVNGSRTGSYADPGSTNRMTALIGGNSGNNVGSVQEDQVVSHNHNYDNEWKYLQRLGHQTINAGLDNSPNEPDIIQTREIQPYGGAETRPNNAYVNYIIKY